MPDVTQLIEHDHREVEQLFAQFESSQDAQIATQICDELDRHADAEERVFYPVVEAEVTGGKKLASEGEDEHKEARQLIGRIRQTKDPEHLAELVTELKGAIQHHVQEEESEMLPKSREALEPSRLEELGSEFESAKAAVGS